MENWRYVLNQNTNKTCSLSILKILLSECCLNIFILIKNMTEHEIAMLEVCINYYKMTNFKCYLFYRSYLWRKNVLTHITIKCCRTRNNLMQWNLFFKTWNIQRNNPFCQWSTYITTCIWRMSEQKCLQNIMWTCSHFLIHSRYISLVYLVE